MSTKKPSSCSFSSENPCQKCSKSADLRFFGAKMRAQSLNRWLFSFFSCPMQETISSGNGARRTVAVSLFRVARLPRRMQNRAVKSQVFCRHPIADAGAAAISRPASRRRSIRLRGLPICAANTAGCPSFCPDGAIRSGRGYVLASLRAYAALVFVDSLFCIRSSRIPFNLFADPAKFPNTLRSIMTDCKRRKLPIAALLRSAARLLLRRRIAACAYPKDFWQ